MISFCLSRINASTTLCEVDSCDAGYCCNGGVCVKFGIKESLCEVSNGCDILKGDCLTDDNIRHLQSKGIFFIDNEYITYEEEDDDDDPIYNINKSKYGQSDEDDCESENELSEEDNFESENEPSEEDDSASENDDCESENDDCESENDDSASENDDSASENDDDREFEDEQPIETGNEFEEEQLTENEQPTEIEQSAEIEIEQPTEMENEPPTEMEIEQPTEMEIEQPTEMEIEQPTEIEEEYDDRLKVSEDGRCGKDFGICKQGYCCSEFGWCGNTEKYCKKGCQFGFGICEEDEEEEEEEDVDVVISDDETNDPIPVTTTVTDISQDGRCGEEFGSCREGYCCSKWGWCGKTELHCSVSNGCQSEFGVCAKTDGFEIEQKKDGRCGVGIGSCAEGYCCSKWGWCGQSESHCTMEEGCQSEFGACKPAKNTNVDPDGRCGKGIGSCAEGYCCSKWGWCGKSDNHCNIEAGCQSEFGDVCKGMINIGVKHRCGEGYGECPKGQCCSKYGWCGKGKSYCSEGCQSEFGLCHQERQNHSYSDSSIWRCGKNFGSCGKGYCCSKWGWCGKSKGYCDKNLGCQSEFGHCW